MQMTITGRHMDVTEALRSYAIDKLQKAKKHFDQVIDIHVVMSVEKLKHHCEATIHASGKNVHADAEGSDMYAAIDSLADKLERQLTKHKERISERGRGEAKTL
jgi:putative sigma-54 modulation protein